MNPAYLLILILWTSLAHAKIWIKGSRTSSVSFMAHIASLDSDHSSYGEHLLKLKRDEAQSFQIKDQLLKAQEYYLSGQIDSALEIFKKITGLAHSADWSKEERRMIFYSFLRRAQSEKNKNMRDTLLTLASQFIIIPISKTYPDYDLFPPPIIKKLEEIQKNQKSLSINLKKIFPNYEMVLFNGKKFPVKNKLISLPPASYRITALSSSHTIWMKITDLSYITTQSIKKQSLTSGFCKNIKIKKEWMQKETQLFSNANCKNQYLTQKKSFPKNNQKKLEHSTWTSLNGIQKKFKTSSKKLPKWLLIGTAIGTTGVLIFLAVDKKLNPTPNSGDVIF